jgi:hypothetical protein
VNTAALAGPAFAGVLLASVSLSACYWIDALTFALLAVATIFMSALKPTGEHSGIAMLRAIGEIWGGAMALFGLVQVIWIGLACLAVAGATDVISTVLRNAILQNAITDEFRSRISSIQMAVVTGGPRLGDVESGVVASLVSTEFSIVSGGVVCILGALALIWRRRGFWRDETA